MWTKFFSFFSLLLIIPFIAMASSSAQKTVLVVGGAGYIGSHVNLLLHQHGYQTVVIDNLSTGNVAAVKEGIFIEGNIADSNLLDEIFTTYQIDAVMHFAAYLNIGESVEDPLKYYNNNVVNTLNLLERMLAHDVKVFIFSSTAAIFGPPQVDCVPEDHPFAPTNPYGRTKLMVEQILEDMAHAYDFKYCCLRYFNAAGGDPDGVLKNYNSKQTSLISVLLRNIENPNPTITIFGTDYPTPDGTGVRDYVHVMDLASAHIAAMERLFNGEASTCYNLGNGSGFSVKEVITAVEEISGKKVDVIEGERRPGDLPTVIANSDKAMKELNWQPRYPSLKTIIEHSWEALKQ